MTSKSCPFDVDIARDAGPADRLHHIGAVYAYRYYRPDAEVAERDWSDRIAEARDALEQAEHLLRDAVAEARGEGATWDQIGLTFGTSRQAAQKRFG